MALKIRLRQQGRRNRPFYRLVVTDMRTRRDGKYHEALGWYDPLAKEDAEQVFLNADRVQHWLDSGAILSDNVRALLKRNAPEIVTKLQQKEDAYYAKEASKRKARSKAA